MINISVSDKVILIVIGVLIFFIVTFLVAAMILNYKEKTGGRIRKKEHFLIRLGGKILNFFSPPRDSVIYKRTYLKLRESGLKMSVRKFYMIRLLIPIIIIVPVVVISNYNIDYSNKALIRKSKISKADIIVNNKSEIDKDYIKNKEKNNERYFILIKNYISIKEIKTQDKVKEISNILMEEASLGKQESIIVAQEMQEKIRRIKSKINLIFIIVITLFTGYYLPGILLSILHYYKTINREGEKILINELVIGLGYIKNIKVVDILKQLKDTAVIYKYLFKTCLDDFESGDAEEALTKLKDETLDQDIIELADFLIFAQTGDSINSIVGDYELKLYNRNKTLESMESIKQERLIGNVTLLISISLFIVVFSMLEAMVSIFNTLNF